DAIHAVSRYSGGLKIPFDHTCCYANLLVQEISVITFGWLQRQAESRLPVTFSSYLHPELLSLFRRERPVHNHVSASARFGQQTYFCRIFSTDGTGRIHFYTGERRIGDTDIPSSEMVIKVA